jgi:hypothetical protein
VSLRYYKKRYQKEENYWQQLNVVPVLVVVLLEEEVLNERFLGHSTPELKSICYPYTNTFAYIRNPPLCSPPTGMPPPRNKTFQRLLRVLILGLYHHHHLENALPYCHHRDYLGLLHHIDRELTF